MTIAEKPLRTIFIQHTSLCDQYGGVEYYLNDLVSLAAAAEGVNNVKSVIARRAGTHRLFTYPVQFVDLSSNRWLQKIENRFSSKLYRATSDAIEQLGAQVIIGSHVSLGPLAYRLSKKHRIPYYLIGYGIECWGNLWPQDEWCLRRADGVIAISHWTKKILVDRGYRKNTVEIIQPRLPEAFENIPPIIRPERKTLTLLTVSRLDGREQYKGQDHVLRALHQLRLSNPSVKIRYIIQGDGSDKERLEALSQKLNLTSLVEFRPKVADRNELESLYRLADVFIMPSRFGFWDRSWRGEGFGIVYLEAAAFGLPSIAYDCGGATDIIRDRKNGLLVEADHIGKLADAIRTLDTDRELLKQLGIFAKTHAETFFGERAIRKQWTVAVRKLKSKLYVYPSQAALPKEESVPMP
jgi:phosphatidylinositol alpha-1,6-mannosyltransferase